MYDEPIRFEEARRRMVERHLVPRGVQDQRLLEAMLRVPRERFMPDEVRYLAYSDRAVAIACGQTISQPLMVALMTQELGLVGDEHVLEIGTGSGYQTAVLAELARDVVSIERHSHLSHEASRVLAELGYSNVKLIVGDGTLGDAADAPYDRILVTAAAASCPPALFEQLAERGWIVIPVGDSDAQTLESIHKIGGRQVVRELMGCRFVPLVAGEE